MVRVADKAAVRVALVAGKVARGAEAKREDKAVRGVAVKVVAEVVRVPAADRRVAKGGKGVDRAVAEAGKVARGAEAKREDKAVRGVAVKVVAEVVRVPVADRRAAKAGKGVDRAVVARVVAEAVKVLVAGRRVGKVANRAARVVAKAAPGAVRRVAKAGAASRALAAKALLNS